MCGSPNRLETKANCRPSGEYVGDIESYCRPCVCCWRGEAPTVAISVFPPALVGHALSGRDAFILLPGASASAFAVAAAVWSIGRRDIPLEAAQ